jgi:hypothetical protein
MSAQTGYWARVSGPPHSLGTHVSVSLLTLASPQGEDESGN